MVTLFLIFGGTAILFSIGTAPFYISINSATGSSLTLVTFPLFKNSSYSINNKVQSDISLWFVMISDVEHQFMCLLVICVFSLKKCLSLPVFIGWFFCCDVGVLFMFYVLTPYKMYSSQIFPPIPWVAFLLCWLDPFMLRSFKFWWSSILSIFSFIAYAKRVLF